MKKTKKEIEKNIKKLNELTPNLKFYFSEDECSCAIENKSLAKGHKNSSFGVFSHIFIFEDYPNKKVAYEMCNMFLLGLISGTKLLDDKSYHNFIAKF